MPTLPRRWSHLVRHGLIGTSLLGAAAARPAAAEPCADGAERTIALVLGLQIAPKARVVAGVEGRQCLADNVEGLVRVELGGGAPRLIAGVRARPFEQADRDGDLEHLGIEAGGLVDSHARFGVHLAGTYGTNIAYLALQANVPVSDPAQPTRIGLLAGLAPWSIADEVIVEGRPILAGGRVLRPRVTTPLPAARSAEARAVRDHYVSSAQVELSSVWTFLRLAAELAAAGAPGTLVAAALDAADDEVRHAELCAQAAGGLGLAALPAGVAQPRFTARSPHALALLAREAWLEGCLNETAAAEEARLASAEASGPARAMLATIARDEAGHAELSWAVLAWVASVAPGLAHATIARLPRPVDAPVPAPVPAVDLALARHGVPTAAITSAARAHAASTAGARLAALPA